MLLLGKRLTVHGNKEEFFCMFEATLGSRAKRCSFTRASTCYLCENLFTRTTVRELFGSKRWGGSGTLPKDFTGNI